MSQLTFSPKARSDLSDIWVYSAKSWGLDQADHYIRQISATCQALANGQLRGQDAGHVRPGYFKQRSGSHMVYFIRPDPHQLIVMRILHKSMDHERRL